MEVDDSLWFPPKGKAERKRKKTLWLLNFENRVADHRSLD